MAAITRVAGLVFQDNTRASTMVAGAEVTRRLAPSEYDRIIVIAWKTRIAEN